MTELETQVRTQMQSFQALTALMNVVESAERLARLLTSPPDPLIAALIYKHIKRLNKVFQELENTLAPASDLAGESRPGGGVSDAGS